MINEKDYLNCWCPQCGHQLQIHKQYWGKSGRCKYCHTKFNVPLPADDTVDVRDNVPIPSKPNNWVYILVGFGIAAILFGVLSIFLFKTQPGITSKEESQAVSQSSVETLIEPDNVIHQPIVQETVNGIPIEIYYTSMLANLKSQLLDPDSLQIDNVYYITKGGGMTMIFDFRSKNGFGGYAQGWAVESKFEPDGSLTKPVWILDGDDVLIPALLKESNNPVLYTPPNL